MTNEKKKIRLEADVFSELGLLCTSPGYIHAIAFFCLRDNSVLYGDTLTAEDLSQNYSRSRLIRTEISTLLGLMATETIDVTHPSTKTIEEYIIRTEALLEELHEAMMSDGFSPENWADIISSGTNPFENGSALREPIFYGGESAYSFQYTALAPQKYAADAAWLTERKHFNMEQASRFGEALSSLLAEKQVAHIKELKETPPDNWTMLPAFTFTAPELAEKSGIDLATTEAILKAFSFPRTSRNVTFSSLSEFNLTNALPILEIEQGRYALFQFYSLAESLYESPFFWMCADKSYADSALAHRGEFTERFSQDNLTRVFGPSRVLRNVRLWRGKDEIGEIDTLVLFGHCAIVLQAKSKRLTQEARKGNDNQIKDDFKKAVHASYDQAYNCASAILDRTVSLTDSSGTTLNLGDPPKTIFPICVVSDHYPAPAFQARQFLKSHDHPIIAKPLVIDVFTLDTMTEMLSSPLYFLSYLHRRDHFGDKVMAMHEHTLLSTHIKYNLWVNDEVDFVTFEDDISVHLDTAMAVRRTGIPGDRNPKGILTKLAGTPLGHLVAQIETEESQVPIELGFLLLEMSEDTIDFLNKYIAKIASDSRTDRKQHDITVSFRSASAGLTIHSNYKEDEQAKADLKRHCLIRKYSQKARKWFGIVIDPDSGLIRFGLKIEAPWKFDPSIETASKAMKGQAFRPNNGSIEKVGRNDPCTCGSGKKFKKCCGSA